MVVLFVTYCDLVSIIHIYSVVIQMIAFIKPDISYLCSKDFDKSHIFNRYVRNPVRNYAL